MKAAFFTFGCKVNQYETEALSQLFQENGYEIVPQQEIADLYLINSCTVTADGDSKVRRLVRRLRREHPGAILVLTGCYAQAGGESLGALLPEADVITGAKDRRATLRLVEQAVGERRQVVSIPAFLKDEPFEPLSLPAPSGPMHSRRTRAFLKIQDGCQRFCAYCAIPLARGPFRSRSLLSIRQECERLAAAGFCEVVLAGVNLSGYGLESPDGPRLPQAAAVAAAVPGIERVRLSSLEPDFITDADIAALASNPALCPQFHLSLQSGSDATLNRMRRHYTTAQYRELVDKLFSTFQNPSLTTDIMVGFPGESEAEFLESLSFLESLPLLKAHVFAYSRRPGTVADTMPEQIPSAEKTRRMQRMLSSANALREQFLKTQVGSTGKVLFEHPKNGIITGYCENYTPVRMESSLSIPGRIEQVKLTESASDHCLGEIVAGATKCTCLETF